MIDNTFDCPPPRTMTVGRPECKGCGIGERHIYADCVFRHRYHVILADGRCSARYTPENAIPQPKEEEKK